MSRAEPVPELYGKRGADDQPTRFPAWPLALAVGLNALLAAGCAALVVVAPSRAATLVAAGGIVFLGLAAAGFALMLLLRLRASTLPRVVASKNRPG